MRIAFVSANRENMPDAVMPLGVLYVMASTPKHHTCKLIDLCFESDPLDVLEKELAAFEPDLVAFGMRNIQNNDYTDSEHNIRWYEACLGRIRQTTAAPVVLGGGGFAVMPEGLMKRLRADYGIAGEGELPFKRLVELIEQQHDTEIDRQKLCEIPRMHFFEGDEVRSIPGASTFQDLDALPRPDRSLLDPRYISEVGTVSLQTKRGCPLKCDYCTYPLIEGSTIRKRDPVQIVDELIQAVEQDDGVKHFFIVDSVFNLPPRHAKAICREMIRRNFDTPWTAYANPIGFDRELADLMAESGCAGLEIGSDSGCDEVLLQLKKGFTTEKIRDMRRHCTDAGVPDCHTFILGTESESLEDVQRTLDFVIDLDPFAAILMVWTVDEDALIDTSASADEGAQRVAERRDFREQVCDLLRDQEKQFPRWIIPPLGTNFDARLFSILRRRGLSGPLWQHIKMRPDSSSSRLQAVSA